MSVVLVCLDQQISGYLLYIKLKKPEQNLTDALPPSNGIVYFFYLNPLRWVKDWVASAKIPPAKIDVMPSGWPFCC